MAELDLPDSVLSLVRFKPIEDTLLAIVRDGLPDIPVTSLIEDEPLRPYFIVVRRVPSFSQWDGDPRFVDIARFSVHVFAADPDGDEKGALISEAVRNVMREAERTQKKIPGVGWVSKIKMMAEPARVTDWATSSGPVQYADLPTGMWRYETQYRIEIRRSL